MVHLYSSVADAYANTTAADIRTVNGQKLLPTSIKQNMTILAQQFLTCLEVSELQLPINNGHYQQCFTYQLGGKHMTQLCCFDV